jgi:Domain of unknown function (DUF397)
LTSDNAWPAGGTPWRKASRSTAGNNCVEVAQAASAAAVRDSKNRGGGHLTVGAVAWESFLADVKRGRYDRPGEPWC